jgi:hypothetical protein
MAACGGKASLATATAAAAVLLQQLSAVSLTYGCVWCEELQLVPDQSSLLLLLLVSTQSRCLTYGCVWCEELQQVRVALVGCTRHAHHSADLKVLHHLSKLHRQETERVQKIDQH